MISDIDVYRTVKPLVDRHGEDAPIQAAMRADPLMEFLGPLEMLQERDLLKVRDGWLRPRHRDGPPVYSDGRAVTPGRRRRS